LEEVIGSVQQGGVLCTKNPDKSKPDKATVDWGPCSFCCTMQLLCLNLIRRRWDISQVGMTCTSLHHPPN
jgi:hypothetical protein